MLMLMCAIFCCSVERDRLRELERLARAQMSSQAADRDSACAVMTKAQPGGAPLFTAPVRVSTPFDVSERIPRVHNCLLLSILRLLLPALPRNYITPNRIRTSLVWIACYCAINETSLELSGKQGRGCREVGVRGFVNEEMNSRWKNKSRLVRIT